jgi:hypothetical protein
VKAANNSSTLRLGGGQGCIWRNSDTLRHNQSKATEIHLETTRTTKAWTFTSLQLFREDLEQLMSLLREPRADSDISIEDDKQQYPSLEEMRVQRGYDVHYLRIINHTVGVRVELSSQTGFIVGLPTLSTLNVTDEADLLFYRLKEFLESKFRPSHYWSGKLIPIVLPMMLVGSGTFFIRHYGDPMVPTIVGTLITLALVLSLVGLTLHGPLRAPIAYRVTFKRIDQDVSFVRRNKDAFILSSIFFVLGIVVTLVFQYFK